MAKFTKDVLYPGRYHLANGHKVEYTPDDVKHLHQRLKDMIAAGLQVPASWEHQDDAKPKTAAEWKAARAKFNLGFAESADLTPQGYLAFQLDVPNDEDASRLPSVKFCSPEIVEDFVDGSGKLWPGKSITHIAVTPRPVQHKQQPFMPAQLSCVRLSLEGFEMADEKGKVDDKKADESPDSAKKLKEVLEALKGDGYVLPDDTTMENLLDRLHTAALTKLAATGETPPPPPPEKKDDEKPTEAPATPMMLSLQKENAGLKAAVLKTERNGLLTRIEKLAETGRITKPIKDKLVAASATVQLSLDDAGALQSNHLLSQIEAYEQLSAGHSFPVNQQAIREVEQPGNEANKEEYREVVNRLSRGRYDGYEKSKNGK